MKTTAKTIDGAFSETTQSSRSIEQWVFRFAGLFVLGSLVLSQVHSVYWVWFTAFVGANMLQASFTGFCPLAMILKKVGLQPGTAFSG